MVGSNKDRSRWERMVDGKWQRRPIEGLASFFSSVVVGQDVSDGSDSGSSPWERMVDGKWQRRPIEGLASFSPSAVAGQDVFDGSDSGSSPSEDGGQRHDPDQSFSSCHSEPDDCFDHASRSGNHEGEREMDVVMALPVLEISNAHVRIANAGTDDLSSQEFSQGNASQQGLFSGSSRCSVEFVSACVVVAAVLGVVFGRHLGSLPEPTPCPYPEGCG